jgi:hypothetical protein
LISHIYKYEIDTFGSDQKGVHITKMASLVEKKMQERMRELQKANKACFNCAALVKLSRISCNYREILRLTVVTRRERPT